MGNCIKCGKWYCNCPQDGYCDTCLGKLLSEGSIQQQTSPINCQYNETILNNYNKIISCVVNKPEALQKIGLSKLDAQTFESYVKSALNAPYNYCQYKRILDQLTPYIHNLIAFGICQ